MPAIISLLLFLLVTYVARPLWQRYRSRYSHYLPLDTITNQTATFRVRVQNAIARWMVPSRWRQTLSDRLVVATANSDGGYNSDEGEELDGVPDGIAHHLPPDDRPDLTRRLSREYVLSQVMPGLRLANSTAVWKKDSWTTATRKMRRHMTGGSICSKSTFPKMADEVYYWHKPS